MDAARELEARWNAALEAMADIETRLADINRRLDARPEIDRAALMALAHDLPRACNAPGVQPQTQQRLTRILIQEVVRALGGQWPNRQLAVTMNRMHCKTSDGLTWTVVRVRELCERLGVAAFDPSAPREKTISVDETARRPRICVGSVHRLIRAGVLPATQLMPSAPWEVPTP